MKYYFRIVLPTLSLLGLLAISSPTEAGSIFNPSPPLIQSSYAEVGEVDFSKIYDDDTSDEGDIELVDTVGGLVVDLCCNAIDEYESILCLRIKNSFARFACFIAKNNAKNEVRDQCCGDDPSCSIDPTGNSSNYLLTRIKCLINQLDNRS